MKILGKKLVGYARYNRKDVIDSILQSSSAQNTFAELAQKKHQSPQVSEKKAYEILMELTSACNPNALRVCYWIVKFLKKFMFKSIALYGEEKKEIYKLTSEGKVLFYLPNHKSHMDYLLLSYILFNDEVAPPHIAAGVNLAFFPVGGLFRRTGAYFIRRKIAGNFLYTKFLQHYFDWMLQEKISQEFYMEGGRSRDGKIREAQSGIFTLFLEQIIARGLQDQVYFVPTAITYDRLPEMKGMLGELKGAEKEKESAFSVLGSLSMLWTDHGQVHIQFGKPIPLQSLVQTTFSKKDFHALSKQIFTQVQKQKTTTVSSLVALVLLSTTSTIEQSEAYERVEWLMQFLKPCRQCISEELANLQKDWDQILQRFEKLGWFERQGSKIRVNATRRVEMNYYKNDLFPVLMPFFEKKNDHIAAIFEHEYPYANHSNKKRNLAENEIAFLNQVTQPMLGFYKAVLNEITERKIENLLGKDAQKNILAYMSAKKFEYPEMITTEAVKSACLFFHTHAHDLKDSAIVDSWNKILN